MRITLQELKNTMKVAKHTGRTEQFSAEIKNENRDISIFIAYHPDRNPKEDIYPYWTIDMREEEFCKTVYENSKNLAQVRDIYNGFVNQGINESYLENTLTR